MKYCIIGSGAFGINLSYNLLKKGHEITLITNKLESVSSIYARGISLKLPSTQWLRNVYFKMNNLILFDLSGFFLVKNLTNDDNQVLLRKIVEVAIPTNGNIPKSSNKIK